MHMDYSYNPRVSISLSEPDFKIQEIIKILNTPPHQRSQASIKTLQYHTESISLFRQGTEEHDEQSFKECCQALRYQYYPAGSTVFNIGEKGEYFYIILEGEVSLSVMNDRNILEEVCILNVGGSFGELALLRDQPRSATIRCTKHSHFAILGKSDYLRILGHLSIKKLEDMVVFFMSLPTFAGWSKKSIIKLSYYFKPIKFKRNQIIFSEGDPAESIFIVKKGEVELSKQIKVQKPITRKIGNDGRPLPSLKAGSFLMKAKISIASIGEIIGDDDIMHDITRSITCQCYSATAELLEISKIEFKKRIRSEESLNQLTQRQKAKDSHMASAITLLRVIKEPKTIHISSEQNKGKKILNSIRSLNPWNSAQNLFTRRVVTNNSEFNNLKKQKLMKKAIESVAVCKSLPLSPKILEPIQIYKTVLSPSHLSFV